MILGLYALIAAALFYLGSRAVITAPIWRLYPPGLARFMDCPACTGFWWGCLGQLYLGRAYKIDIGPLAWWSLETMIVAGLCTLVLTPIVTGLMQRGFETTGSAIEPSDTQS